MAQAKGARIADDSTIPLETRQHNAEVERRRQERLAKRSTNKEK